MHLNIDSRDLFELKTNHFKVCMPRLINDGIFIHSTFLSCNVLYFFDNVGIRMDNINLKLMGE